MKRSILVPLDGTKESEEILAELRRFLRPDDEVYLLHVIPEIHAPTGLPPTQVLELNEKIATYLDDVRERWQAVQPGLDLVRYGDPAEGILGEVLEKNIHLIAMSTRGRKGAGRVLLGSVAAEVVRKSQLPVFLARPDQTRATRPIQRILVSLEGSENVKELLETVKILAGSAKAEIILFHATPPVTDPATQWAPSLRLYPESSPEHRLQELADMLGKEGFVVRPLLAAGPPAKEILRQAEALDVDLIALSTQARSGLERLFQGSVAEEVLRESRVPVLLQKPLVVYNAAASGKSHG